MATASAPNANARLGGFGIVLITLVTGILPYTFVMRFSGIGAGLKTANESRDLVDEAKMVLEIVAGLFALGYICDVHFWNPQYLCANIFTFLLLIATTGSLLVTSGENPFWPVCIFTLLLPLFLLVLKYVLFRLIPTKTYVKQCAGIIILMGLALMSLFFAWILSGDGEGWSTDTRAKYAFEAGCKPEYEGFEGCLDRESGRPCFYTDVIASNVTSPVFDDQCKLNCINVYESCSVAFIIWINPALAAMSLIVMGFLVDYAQARDPFNHKVRLVVEATCGFLFLFWIFASLIGAGSGLTTSLIAFAISLSIGSAIIMWAIVVSDEIAEHHTEDMIAEALENTESFLDIIKGFAILAATPLLILYLVLSFLREQVRKLKACFCCAPLEHRGWLTERTAGQIDDLRNNWNHSNVLTYAIYIGFTYVLFGLFTKLTTLFLSFLIEVTSTMDILSVTGIVTAVGMLLFMLPPVPGIPIYLASGIVLVSIGRQKIGLEQSITYAIFVSLFIKLLACTIQQKIIGGLLGGSTSVKQMVGINSEAIRAMRLILEEPGLNFNKVAILVGGPDWPVSVLCGILGLDLIPILIGTVPVIVVVAPTVLSGSFAYMGSIEKDGHFKYPWADTWGTVVSSLLGGVMLCCSLAAAKAVASAVSERKAEIDALAYDEDVRKADEEAKERAVFRKKTVVWSNVPCFFKSCLILSVLCMIVCVYALALFGEQCYEDYDLMYTISEHLEGNLMNLVKPLGRKALILCCVSLVLFEIFSMWAGIVTKKAIATSKSAESASLLQSSTGSYV